MRTITKNPELEAFRAKLDAELGPIEPAPAAPVTARVKVPMLGRRQIGVLLARSADNPAPMSHNPLRRDSIMTRQERRHLARSVEDFRRNSRTKGKSGRTNQGAISAAAVEIIKYLAFDRWNAKTGRCDPSQRTIARDTGWHVSTVRRQLRKARAAGLIGWLARPATFIAGAWRRRTHSYLFGRPTVHSLDKKGEGRVAASPFGNTETHRNVCQASFHKLLS